MTPHSLPLRHAQDPIFPARFALRLRHIESHHLPYAVTPVMWGKGFTEGLESIYYDFLDWRFRGWVRIGLLILGLYNLLRLTIFQMTADASFTAQLFFIFIALYCCVTAALTLTTFPLRTIYFWIVPLLFLITWSMLEVNMVAWRSSVTTVNIAQLVTPYAITLVIIRLPLRLGIPVCGFITGLFLVGCWYSGIPLTIPLIALLAAALSATLLFGMILEQEARTDFVHRLTIFQLVTRDTLTGLATRSYFMRALDTALEQSHTAETPVALIVLDIDHFKRVNDTYGHAAGDSVLQAVGAILSEYVGDGGAAGRLGGEEFALVLPHTDTVDALRTAEAICAAIRRLPFHYSDWLFHITISAGVAVTNSNYSSSGDQLYQRADHHLYAAKANGRDCVMGTHPHQKLDAA